MKPSNIVLSNGILKSTKDVEVYKTYALIHDITSGWITYKVPINLYKQFKSGKINYWDMCLNKKSKSW